MTASALSATKAQVEASVFEIGGEDQLAKLRRESASAGQEKEDATLVSKWEQCLQDIRVRVGTLLKTENVSFLLGAGASREAGGVLVRTLPLGVESLLLQKGISGNRIRSWLRLFYSAAARLARGPSPISVNRTQILQRADIVRNALAASGASQAAIQVNFEALLSLLYRWRSALLDTGNKLRIDGSPPVVADTDDLDECIEKATAALTVCCQLPTHAAGQDAIAAHVQFIKKLLTRPLNLRRVNIFTLNYDTLIEQGADAAGAVLIDGFVGTVNRVFRPESYDQDLYFPAETTEGRVHRFDRVLHLCKLHGSITWLLEPPSQENPYGIRFAVVPQPPPGRVLVYPTPAKFGETLGMPYAELFRRFAISVARPQSTLFVVGYGFGDDHVNAILRQALAIPTFTLVVIDPYPPTASASTSGFIERLRAQSDRRFWLFGGERLGVFSKCVADLLPDLRDEEIERRVLETRRALADQNEA